MPCGFFIFMFAAFYLKLALLFKTNDFVMILVMLSLRGGDEFYPRRDMCLSAEVSCSLCGGNNFFGLCFERKTGEFKLYCKDFVMKYGVNWPE